jgi:hypothetical protein
MRSKKRLIISLSALAVTLGPSLYCARFALGPDQEMAMTREVHSPLGTRQLDRSLSVLAHWPQWNFMLADATFASSPTNSAPAGKELVQTGSRIKLGVQPKNLKRRRFELLADVTKYIPQEELSMKLAQDSSGRLTRLFDRLEWRVELVPQKTGTLVRGVITARTSHWRSRLFAGIAPKILLNQVFYADLQKLAADAEPLAVELVPRGP